MGFRGAAAAPSSADIGALTDSTGETADSTIALCDTTVGTSATASCGAVGCNSNHPTAASVDTALGLVNTRLDTINKNFADLTAQINEIRTNLRAVGLMK